MIPSYSPEGRMISRLLRLGCSESAFQKIAQGICGKNRIIEAFKDPAKSFDNETARALMERIVLMEELAQVVAPIPIDWSCTEKVTTALMIRLVNQTVHELGLPNDLTKEAEWATKRVTGVTNN